MRTEAGLDRGFIVDARRFRFGGRRRFLRLDDGAVKAGGAVVGIGGHAEVEDRAHAVAPVAGGEAVGGAADFVAVIALDGVDHVAVHGDDQAHMVRGGGILAGADEDQVAGPGHIAAAELVGGVAVFAAEVLLQKRGALAAEAAVAGGAAGLVEAPEGEVDAPGIVDALVALAGDLAPPGAVFRAGILGVADLGLGNLDHVGALVSGVDVRVGIIGRIGAGTGSEDGTEAGHQTDGQKDTDNAFLHAELL